MFQMLTTSQFGGLFFITKLYNDSHWLMQKIKARALVSVLFTRVSAFHVSFKALWPRLSFF
jgi:hypothetical protein